MNALSWASPRRVEGARLAEGADEAVLVEARSRHSAAVAFSFTPGSVGRRLTEVSSDSERFLPHRLRRVTSKKPRGAA